MVRSTSQVAVPKGSGNPAATEGVALIPGASKVPKGGWIGEASSVIDSYYTTETYATFSPTEFIKNSGDYLFDGKDDPLKFEERRRRPKAPKPPQA